MTVHPRLLPDETIGGAARISRAALDRAGPVPALPLLAILPDAPGPDTIPGSEDADQISGGAGADSLNGKGGVAR